MTKETMNIHEALSEIKTLRDRIDDKIGTCVFVKANKHSNTKIDGKTIDEYKAYMRSSCQSVEDLIKRMNAIKRAVILSNATTCVTVNGEVYTVAEAIDMKNNGIVPYDKMLKIMAFQWMNTKRSIEDNSGEKLERRAEEYVRSMLGASKSEKNDAEWIRSMREDYIKNNTFDIVDPNNIGVKIESMEEWVSGFMSKIDSALSTSNAITKIEIEY